ncbi:MAG: hypothetical protein ACKVQW_04670 [Pyrinomonadaceae bacterium]
MARPEVSHHENIVRAIHSAWWDIHANRGFSSVFKGQNNSVSRLSILNLTQLFEIFHTELDSSPNGQIVGAGEINVGRLIEIGQQHIKPIELTVEEAPLPENRAHAEIPQKISKGLANSIIRELSFHKS